MNKVQDGFASIYDSYKPLTISSDRRHFASLSFVGDRMVIRPTTTDTEIVVEHSSSDSFIFRLVDQYEEPSEVLDTSQPELQQAVEADLTDTD